MCKSDFFWYQTVCFYTRWAGDWDGGQDELRRTNWDRNLTGFFFLEEKCLGVMSFKEEVKINLGQSCQKCATKSEQTLLSYSSLDTCNIQRATWKSDTRPNGRRNIGTACWEERSPTESPPAMKWQPHIFQIAAVDPNGMNPLNGPLNH